MKSFLLSAAFIMMFIPVMAQSPSQAKTDSNILTKGAALMFKDVSTRLTPVEKNMIFKKLGFVLSGDENQPFAQDLESIEFPFIVQTFPTDMNKDSKEEIFVIYGNSYTSGSTGSSVVLFIKDGNGQYQNNLGFPGIPQALADLKGGYNDLLIGGPRFTYPVWRWNGKEYALYKTIKDSDLKNMKILEIQALSKDYSNTF